MDGVLPLLKPPGCSSHDVVAAVRRRYGSRAGHLGTLDPLAAGVLVVAVGAGTRLIRYAGQEDKEYFAEVVLGVRSPSDDLGTPVERAGTCSGIGEEQVRRALAGFVGVMAQRPPSYSARQVGGERAYRAARSGRTLQLASREVALWEARLLEFLPGRMARARLHLHVQAGYYVRSLARDLGEELGVGGLLGTLVRIRAGRFPVEDAQTLEETWRPLDASVLVEHLPVVEFEAADARRLCQGVRLPAATVAQGVHRAVSRDRVFAIVVAQDGVWRPQTVLGMGD